MKSQRVRVGLAAAAAAFLLTAATAAQAAPGQQQQIAFAFNSASFQSILGGTVNGSARLAGQIGGSPPSLSRLQGGLNFPLKDFNLSVDPTGPVQTSTGELLVQWTLYQCEPFPACFPVPVASGTATYSVTTSQAPVGIRFASFHGNGTLSWTQSACVAACPPPGASFFAPSSSSGLSGAVVSAQDAGTVNMSGPAPTIQ
jgi:hypothetical protein